MFQNKHIFDNHWSQSCVWLQDLKKLPNFASSRVDKDESQGKSTLKQNHCFYEKYEYWYSGSL